MTNEKKLCYATADPLDFIARARSPHAAASRFSEALIPPGTHQDTHWSAGAQGRFVANMMFVKFDPLFEPFGRPRTMRSVWNTLSDPELEKQTLRMMMLSDDNAIADQAAAALRGLKNNSPEQQSIRNHLRVACSRTLNEPAILDCLSGTNVDFSTMHVRPATYYIVIPGDMAQTHNKFMRLLVTMIFGEIERMGLRDHE